jgi:hypothetical protein
MEVLEIHALQDVVPPHDAASAAVLLSVGDAVASMAASVLDATPAPAPTVLSATAAPFFGSPSLRDYVLVYLVGAIWILFAYLVLHLCLCVGIRACRRGGGKTPRPALRPLKTTTTATL